MNLKWKEEKYYGNKNRKLTNYTKIDNTYLEDKIYL